MLGSVHSEGCNFLIRDNKASIFTSVDDMATAVGWHLQAEEPKMAPAVQMQTNFEGFTQDEGQILSLLRQKGTMQIDELSWQSGMHFNKLAALLLNLEFQGMVRSLPGKKYGLI
jgi:DNA processing protein